MSQKVFDNNLAQLHKSEFTLKLNKTVYAGMCKLDLNKVLMYEFHYDCNNHIQDGSSRGCSRTGGGMDLS